MVCGHQGVLDVLSTDKMFSFRDDHFRISKKVKIKTKKKKFKIEENEVLLSTHFSTTAAFVQH